MLTPKAAKSGHDLDWRSRSLRTLYFNRSQRLYSLRYTTAVPRLNTPKNAGFLDIFRFKHDSLQLELATRGDSKHGFNKLGGAIDYRLSNTVHFPRCLCSLTLTVLFPYYT